MASIADVVSRCWSGRSHDDGLRLPLHVREKGGEAARKFETSLDRYSNPCNFLNIACIRKILAAACSHRKTAHTSLLKNFWTSGLLTGPSKKLVLLAKEAVVAYFARPIFVNTSDYYLGHLENKVAMSFRYSKGVWWARFFFFFFVVIILLTLELCLLNVFGLTGDSLHNY